ncbi:hypothetical protein ABW20_dc0100090 [Dactylellina cionopaga]|nr:hypothetical protein ABW20_dc0100090 [Dactylellina cionopaga]
MSATNFNSESRTSGIPLHAEPPRISDSDASDPPTPLAIIIFENQTAHRLLTLASGAGIRGNATISPSKFSDVGATTSARWDIIPKDPGDNLDGYVKVQMGFLILDRPRFQDCPTVGLEWTCADDGEQEVTGEVNDIDDDAYDGVVDTIEEDGVPKYVFTIRRKGTLGNDQVDSG